MKLLILALDGLRPDHVTPALMPNLCRLRDAGLYFPESRSVFPSETRVNQASLITGCHPARHGLVANKFRDPVLRPGALFNTASYAELDQASTIGPLLTVPSLAERLRAAGGSLAVAGCGTPGGNRLLNLDARAHGEVNVSLHGPDRSATPDMLAHLVERLGPIPPRALPGTAQLAWLTDAYLQVLGPEVGATVTILWFSEPDSSYHYKGLGSAEAAAAIRACDRELGRLLAWRETAPAGRDLQLVVLSDHGHVTTEGPPLDLAAKLAEAGLGAGVDVVPGLCGSLYLNGADPQPICDWLAAQAWCGPLFTRVPVRGAFRLADANLDHVRAGDVVFVLAQSMAVAANGLPGVGRHDNADIPDGGGMHGGLTLAELNNLLLFSGSAFGPARRDPAPAGIVDVAPTILHLLGLPADGMDGRVLTAPAAPATGRTQRAGGITLATRRVGETVYLDRSA
jgi:arylsulfatase A-like enzyme